MVAKFRVELIERNPAYHAISGSPANIAINAPIARKVPNGSANFIPPRCALIRITPMIAPENDDSTSVTSTAFQPRNAPIMASIFTSPMPMPSSRRHR